MITYPKIETLFDRDKDTFAVIPGAYRRQEFALINSWMITEKIDGTNIRIGLNPDGSIEFGGRTDNAQMPPFLDKYLRATFTREKMHVAFLPAYNSEADCWPEVTIFGEGYGPKIQQGGGNYRNDVAFRMFDVYVGKYWLEPLSVADIAMKLGVDIVPTLRFVYDVPATEEDLADLVFDSIVAAEDGGKGLRAEGVVARTSPLLLDRHGNRLMWKLKFKDFKSVPQHMKKKVAGAV